MAVPDASGSDRRYVVFVAVSLVVVGVFSGCTSNEPANEAGPSAASPVTPTTEKSPTTIAVDPASALSVDPTAELPEGRDLREELRRAKAATVYLVSTYGPLVESSEPTSSSVWSAGSGVFVSDRHILTAAHVVDGADSVNVAVDVGEDLPMEFRYQAEAVAVHPYFDITLLEIVDGIALEYPWAFVATERPPAAPEVMELDGSADLWIGQEIHSLGFNAIVSELVQNSSQGWTVPTINVSKGNIVSFQIWPGCNNPEASYWLTDDLNSKCSTGGDLSRGSIVSDDLTSGGASGGPVVVDGKMVAIRYAIRGPREGTTSTQSVAASIPAARFVDWLDKYVSEGRRVPALGPR